MTKEEMQALIQNQGLNLINQQKVAGTVTGTTVHQVNLHTIY